MQTAGLTSRWRNTSSADNSFVRLRTFTRLSRELALATDRSAIIDILVNGAAELVNDSKVVLLLRNGSFHPVAGTGVDLQDARWERLNPLNPQLDANSQIAEIFQKPVLIASFGDPLEGLLAVGCDDGNECPEAAWLLAALLDHGSLALDHARLLEQDRKRLENSFNSIETEEQRQMMMAAMAHDLRSPLLSIRMGCDLLEETLEPPTEDQRELLQHMRIARNHLQSIAENLLEMGRLSAGMAALDCRLEKLGPVLNEAVIIVRPEAKPRGIIIDLPEDIFAKAWFDEPRLRQVLVNLLGNAIKFSPDNATITITVDWREDKDVYCISISDQGPGIAAEEQEDIFRPYRKASAMKSYKGIGLGLTIAQELTRKMGGDVLVKSTPGNGARFDVELLTQPPQK